ncbi:hypothetical protein, partial [Methylogaea oryzae]|uniref:hypothetical protein n=1 Tax=Methylogaea oryzae TaxID=1295382 RepID=UPI001C3F3DFB
MRNTRLATGVRAAAVSRLGVIEGAAAGRIAAAVAVALVVPEKVRPALAVHRQLGEIAPGAGGLIAHRNRLVETIAAIAGIAEIGGAGLGGVGRVRDPNTAGLIHDDMGPVVVTDANGLGLAIHRDRPAKAFAQIAGRVHVDML